MKLERTLSAALQAVCAICILGTVPNAQPGEVEPGFAPAVNGPITSVAAQADGKLVIGGMFTEVNGVARPYLARLNPNGSLDATFNMTAGPGQFVNHVEVAQSRLFVSGGDGIRRFSNDGSLDWHYPMHVTTFAVDSEQRVVFGGRFVRIENQYHRNLARLTPQGGLDAAFAPAIGCCAADGVDSILATGDRMIVGGVFQSVNGEHITGNLARIGADGAVDSTFIGAAAPPVLDLEAAPDGKIYSVSELVVARHLSDGSVDSGFVAPSPAGFDERFLTVATQGDKVLVGGNFTLNSGATRHLARFLANGSLDASFAVQPNGTVRDIAVQADGSVVIVGDFTEVNGQSRPGVARIGSTPAAAPSLATSLSAAGLVVSWPASASNDRLEFRELDQDTWKPVGLTPVTANGRCCVTNPISGPGRLYRLVRP